MPTKRKRTPKQIPIQQMVKNNEVVQLTAAGGVLYQAGTFPKKVLLIKRNGFWDLPKGKLEEGETLEECAVREVEEEVGVKNLSTEKFLCETYHTYQENGQTYGKTTAWYSMKFENPHYDFKPQRDEGITDVKWVNIDRARSMVEFENLVMVLNKMN